MIDDHRDLDDLRQKCKDPESRVLVDSREPDLDHHPFFVQASQIPDQRELKNSPERAQRQLRNGVQSKKKSAEHNLPH
jgi:hypothetical protein